MLYCCATTAVLPVSLPEFKVAGVYVPMEFGKVLPETVTSTVAQYWTLTPTCLYAASLTEPMSVAPEAPKISPINARSRPNVSLQISRTFKYIS